jgi:malonyl-CoA O-methyltransferase
MNHNRFSNAASTYDQHAAPQLELIKTLLENGPPISPHRILDVGAGTGLLTEQLAIRYPNSSIDAIDLVKEMIEQSQTRLHHLRQINWIQADAETYTPQESYSLIASSAALHWSTNLTATLQNLYNALQPGGHFLLGLMLRGTLWELRELRRRIAPTKGIGLSLPTENHVTEQIEITGFDILHSSTAERRHIYPNTRDFLQAIHEQGVTALPQNDLPLNRSELISLIHAYETNHATAGGIYATYETACYLLKKPETP